MPRQNYFYIAFSLLCVGYACYLFNPFQLYFLNDDFIHIPLSKKGVLFQRNSFRPVGDLSIRMDYLLWGKQAWGYHTTNLLLHLLNTAFVFLLTKTLFQKYTNSHHVSLKAWMVSILFFVYAFHSESIFWIIGRSGSLGSLFFLLSLLLYFHRSKSLGYYVLSLAFFIIGLLTYESVWIFPLAALLFSWVDYKLTNLSGKKEWIYPAIVFMVFIAMLFIRRQVIGEVVGGYEGVNFNQFKVGILVLNFIKLTARLFIPPMSTQIFLIFCLVLLAIFVSGGLIIKSRRKMGAPGYFLPLIVALLFVSLLPYLSLGIDTHSEEGERYLYLPSIFACIALVAIIHSIVKSVHFQMAFFAIIVLYNLYFLDQSARSYKTASAITRTAIAQVNLLKDKRRLFVDSLPQTINGALIFRLGFEEGIEWLKAPGSVDSVIILSLKQVSDFSYGPYNAQILTNQEPNFSGQVLVKDPSQKQTYISEMRALNFNAKTDAWLVFKNNGLQVVK